MNALEKKITPLIQEIVEQNNFLLIDFVVRGNVNSPVLEIFIDGETSISVEDCASLSRLLNERIESDDLIKTSYRLEVSSPGVDKPLKFLQQFKKHINRNFELLIAQSTDETKKVTGKLLSIENEILLFRIQNKEELIPFSTIKKAKVILSFS